MQQGTAGTVAGDFVRALALAWKNLAAYPPGHPALSGAIDTVAQRLGELRGPASEVVFGVAVDGLVYGDDKIDTTYAQKFAHALYTRGVALLRFESETGASEIESFLRLVGVGSPTGSAQPIWEQLTGAGVTSINLRPVDYSDVQITDNLTTPVQKAEPSVSLWDEILRALLAGQEISADARQTMTSRMRSLDDLSALILRYTDSGPEAEFDPKATFGVKFNARVPAEQAAGEAAAARIAEAIGAFVSDSSGLKRQLAVQQLVQLLRTLPEEIRALIMKAVIRALATDDTGERALREFARDVPRDELLDALRYLSTMTRISGHAVSLLKSLTPERDPGSQLPTPPPSVLADLVHLFGEEDLDRFNPPDHTQLLDQISVDMPRIEPQAVQPMEVLGDLIDTVASDVVNRNLGLTLIDLLTSGSAEAPGPLLLRGEAMFRDFLGGGEYNDALQYIRQLQDTALRTSNLELQSAIHESFTRLCSTESMNSLVDSLLTAPPEKSSSIQNLIEVMGSAAIRTLLMSLAEESNRSRRRKLLNFLTSFGSLIVPEVVSFLHDERWYVVRNMISLLRAVGDRSSIPEVRRYAHHRDLRVRLEAIKTLLAFDSSVPRALLENAIRDPDPKLAETAISLVGSYGIREAVDPLLRILSQSDIFGSRIHIRIKVIRALGELAEPSALKRMNRFFSNSLLPWPARDERRAAFESLAGYPAELRAPLIAKGLRSRDSTIREICRRMTGS